MTLLKLIRWPNLLMIVMVQYMIRFFIIESLEIPHVLNHWYYFYGVICSIGLAAAGYVINDIYDLDADGVNKPQRVTIGKHFTIVSAWQIYFGINLLAVFMGYLVSKAAGMPALWMLPLVAIALLYFYAISLKKIAVIGNLTVSLLTALPVILVALFDLIPAINMENQQSIKEVVKVISAYALFAFWSNFIREIVKDAEDYKGDKKQGYRTLAIIVGQSQIRYIIVILTLTMLIFTAYFNLFLFQSSLLLLALYILLFVNLPLLYFIYQIFIAKKSKDFKRASTIIKIIMLTGILSMVVFTVALKLGW